MKEHQAVLDVCEGTQTHSNPLVYYFFFAALVGSHWLAGLFSQSHVLVVRKSKNIPFMVRALVWTSQVLCFCHSEINKNTFSGGKFGCSSCVSHTFQPESPQFSCGFSHFPANLLTHLKKPPVYNVWCDSGVSNPITNVSLCCCSLGLGEQAVTGRVRS